MVQASSRRKHPRRALDGVELLCYRTTAGILPRVRKNIAEGIVDISQGGARIRLTEEVTRGDSITLELKDGRSGEVFRARGEVRWCEGKSPHLAGVQFSEVYTPMGNREKFTVGAVAPTVTAEKAPEPRAPSEKRRVPRFEVDDYIVTCLRQGTLSTLGLKRNLARGVADIGRQGAKVSVSEPIDTGSMVVFTLHLNKFADTLEATAIVRWCRPESGPAAANFLVGLQFVDLPDAKKKMIDFMMGWFTSYQHKYRKDQKP